MPAGWLTAEPSLGQEPWGFHTAQIADLTDRQIELFYRRPAIVRANADRGIDPPRGDGPKPPVPREEFVADMLAHHGGTRDHWDAVYDRYAAEVEEYNRGRAGDPP